MCPSQKVGLQKHKIRYQKHSTHAQWQITPETETHTLNRLKILVQNKGAPWSLILRYCSLSRGIMSSVDRPRVFSRSFSLCRLPPGASLLVPISSWPPFCQRFLHQLAQKRIWTMAFASTLWIMQTSVHIFVLQACSGNNSIFPQTIIALLPHVTVNVQTLPVLVRPLKGKSPVILIQGLPISCIMLWKKMHRDLWHIRFYFYDACPKEIVPWHELETPS
jgi:hypothetical protein